MSSLGAGVPRSSPFYVLLAKWLDFHAQQILLSSSIISSRFNPLEIHTNRVLSAYPPTPFCFISIDWVLNVLHFFYTRTFTLESKFVFQMHFIRFTKNKKGGHLHTPIIRTLYTHSIIFFNLRAVETSLTFIAITPFMVPVIVVGSRAPWNVTMINSCAAVV